MPNTINLRLLDNRNIVAEMGGIPLAQQNSYKIIAGEKNATQFKIITKPTEYEFAQYTVEMVNSQGYGIMADDIGLVEKNPNEYIIENDEFILPKGMAVAGYGWVQIRAYQDDEVVPFATLKVKVWNTIPNWKEHIITNAGASSIDVQINGTSIVEDGVANIPIAEVVPEGAERKTGVVRLGAIRTSGLWTDADENNTLKVAEASKKEIDTRSTVRPIIPPMLDYAVKVGVTKNKEALTEEEQKSAKEWLGAKLYKHTLWVVDPEIAFNLHFVGYSQSPTSIPITDEESLNRVFGNTVAVNESNQIEYIGVFSYSSITNGVFNGVWEGETELGSNSVSFILETYWTTGTTVTEI